ncbi:hypothetical protein G7Y89_g12798 [Cudoniella acicularis]|uniref:Uncharacterized protein n=1 Tax=Cudoniella acicularis TaxID=354080 RepID=A0A8H4R837_9HELO|nr:hypothetical protein G7Y89_g12798 [Cudoniella acicularis]
MIRKESTRPPSTPFHETSGACHDDRDEAISSWNHSHTANQAGRIDIDPTRQNHVAKYHQHASNKLYIRPPMSLVAPNLYTCELGQTHSFGLVEIRYIVVYRLHYT